MNGENIYEHYGYDEKTGLEPGVHIGHWPNEEGIFEKLKLIPELLDPKQKVQVVFDYDPDFPRALIRIRGVKPVRDL